MAAGAKETRARAPTRDAEDAEDAKSRDEIREGRRRERGMILSSFNERKSIIIDGSLVYFLDKTGLLPREVGLHFGSPTFLVGVTLMSDPFLPGTLPLTMMRETLALSHACSAHK